jgi:uncharacterized protein YhfF
MNDCIKNFWEEFVVTLPEKARPETYSAWAFGNTPEMADNLGHLVLRGNKRATTSLAWIYEKFPEEKMPVVNEFGIILNSLKEPLCIIKTISVTKRAFREIDEDYARTEGEGDGSLRHWKEVHWKFFLEECKLVGREPDEDMPVICEVFKVVYPA